jgi:hypothetical protein
MRAAWATAALVASKGTNGVPESWPVVSNDNKNWSSGPSIGGLLLVWKEAQPIQEMAGAVRTNIAT